MTWLARTRILSGLSVAQAARACGLNARSWAGWEQGRKTPNLGATIALSFHFPTLPLICLGPKAFAWVSPATLEVLP